MTTTHAYGWRPQKPDFRDVTFSLYRAPAVVPTHIDMRPDMPPVYDQGQLGSCTGNGIAGAIEYMRGREGLTKFTPSRLFIYYNERVMEGTVATDAGAEIRDGIKSVNQLGACPEADWPYDPAQFAAKPPDQCYADAKTDLVTGYAAVPQTLAFLRGCMAARIPVVFGFTVYSSFESDAVAASAMVPMPATSDTVVGGHCVLAVGYSDRSGVVICRNSWGAGWGDGGYFYLPYAYIADTNLASDFWQVDVISKATQLRADLAA